MEDKYTIPNLKRACEILSFLRKNHGAMSYAEIASALEFPRTTVLRILETLVDANYLSRTVDKKYALGENLVTLANMEALRANIGDIAFPFLKKITELTGETSHIAILSGDKVLIAKVCESSLALHAASKAGTFVDAHCSGTGKVLLAFCAKKNPSLIKKIKLTKRTKQTITNVSQLNAELAITEKRGYSLDNEEYHNSIRCMAVPVQNLAGEVIAAIGITVPAIRFPDKIIPKLYEILSDEASALRDRLSSMY